MKTKKSRSIRSYITNNLALKIISLVFALILWGFVTNTTNPERTKTLYEIPVVVQGLEALEEKGLTLRDDLTKNVPTVKVKVNVKNSDFRLVNKNVVFASVDVSEITRDGSNSVSVIPTFSNTVGVSLVSVEPQVLNLTVDKIVSKNVPVSLVTTNSLPSGLVSVAPVYDKTVTVSGSSYYVERITDAIVDVDLSTLTDGAVFSTVCRFTDKDNNAIRFDGVKVNIDMDVQTRKEISVIATDSVINTDKVAKGYVYKGISAGKVTVCGHTDVLQGLTSITAAPIDVSGKDASFEPTLELILPEGVTLIDEAPKARVEIAPEEGSVTVIRNIIVTGIEGRTVTLSDVNRSQVLTADGGTSFTATVTLTGPKIALQTISEADVIVALELDSTSSGTVTPRVKLSAQLSASGVRGDLVSPTQLAVSIN